MGKWIWLFGVFISGIANAQWTVRPQAGLGFTDNANYEETDKDSDFFWWVRDSNTFRDGNHRWNLWINYRGYLKEHQNEFFSYRMGDTYSFNSHSMGALDWDVALGGQQYTQGSPGTTEQSFSNVYMETSLLKNWSPRANLDFSLEPLFQIKHYPSLDGRIDKTLLFNFTTDWQFLSDQSLNPFAELGFVFSNDSLYSKNYWEFGTDWRYLPSSDLKYILSFLSRYSTFPNRTVSAATVVTNKRGQIKMSSQDEMETQSLTQFQGSVVKMLGKMELRSSLGITNQTSRSGYENYTETQVQCSILVPFDFSTRRP